MSARTTERGALPPANSVAAPIERAVATAGAMWVMDWNRTSVSPMAPRSRVCSPGLDADEDIVPPSPPACAARSSPPPIGHASGASYAPQIHLEGASRGPGHGAGVEFPCCWDVEVADGI